MLRITLGIALCLIGLCAVAEASDNETRELLARWRVHVLSMGNWAGVELNSPDYRALVAEGPKALPVIFDVYRQEQDTHALYYLNILIGRLGHFDPYIYSAQPMTIGNRQMEDRGEKPYLSREMNKDWSAPESVNSDRDRLVQWWHQRASFLLRANGEAEVRALTGRTAESYATLGWATLRQFQKLQGYGIYNIPLFVKLVAEDNNPVVFCDFLRIGNHRLYQDLHMTADMPGNVAKTTAAYPTVESKLKVICEWWDENRSKYEGLYDLQAAIDKEVQAACGKKG